MVTRLYFCKDCGYEFETVQPMHEELLKTCSECKGELAQDLCGVHLGIKLYNTVGSLAEKNARDLGTYGRQKRELELQQEQDSYKERKKQVLAERGFTVPEKPKDSLIKDPPKSVMTKIAKNDKKGIKDYIMTGKQ